MPFKKKKTEKNSTKKQKYALQSLFFWGSKELWGWQDSAARYGDTKETLCHDRTLPWDAPSPVLFCAAQLYSLPATDVFRLFIF